MHYVVAALLLLIAATTDARSIVRPLFGGEPVALRGDQAHAVFKQCSRAAPVPGKLLSVPTAAEIDRFETAIQRHIAEEYEAGRAAPDETTLYGRQYVAYQEGSTRKLYGNFFPIDVAPRQRGAIVVCDGGNAFWGSVFNPKTGKIEALTFNGRG